jgi:F-type H+-transporting ATPase subunit a
VENRPRWRFGVNRWFVLAFIVLGVIAAGAYPPILPHIQLPAEALTQGPLFSLPVIGDFYLTNTLVATLLADLILLLMAFSVRRATRSGEMVPKGFSGALEALLELLYNLTESTAGKWAKKLFPYFATITLLVLVVNWMELIPGVDSIGWFNAHHIPEEAACSFTGLPFEVVGVGGAEECASGVVPFVRVASTDLNFTVALALMSVAMTQVIGLAAQGAGYLTKFINVKTIFKVPVFGVIDFAVGILEVISEFSKILSFAFRLFGNIFAGSVLLFVIGTLVPVFAQSGVLMLEFFIGLIQAVIFGLLTMTFMAQATVAHGHDEQQEGAH